MRNKIIKSLIILTVMLLTIIVYFNSGYYIKNHQWKYNEGYHIGDWVSFTDQSLDFRTIYKNEEAVAKIVFSYGNKLIIKDLKTGKKGYYSNKGSR